MQTTGNAWGVCWAEAAGYVNLVTVDRTHSGDNVQQKMETAQEVGWSFRDFGTKTTLSLCLSILLDSERETGVGFPLGTLSPY